MARGESNHYLSFGQLRVDSPDLAFGLGCGSVGWGIIKRTYSLGTSDNSSNNLPTELLIQGLSKALSEYKLWIARLIRRRRHHLYGDVLYSLKSISLATDSGGTAQQ